ncbi:MAG: hypothetical protein V4534_00595 [Myxococcota bacterium]
MKKSKEVYLVSHKLAPFLWVKDQLPKNINIPHKTAGYATFDPKAVHRPV